MQELHDMFYKVDFYSFTPTLRRDWSINFILDFNFSIYDMNVSFLFAAFITVTIFYMLLLSKPAVVSVSTYANLFLLVVVSVLFICTTSLFAMLVLFESLLLLSTNLLKLTSKSERIGEAVSEMFM